MPILLDLILVAVLVLFAWLGAKRGFVLTLCGLLAAIVALVGANLLAGFLAPKVAQTLEPVIAEKLEIALQEQYEEQFEAFQSGDSILSSSIPGSQPASLPIDPDQIQTAQREIPLQEVLGALRELGLYEELIDSVDEAVEAGALDAAAGAAAAVAAAVAESVAYTLIFLVSFLLLLLLWSILAHALDLVTKLPGLNFLNKTGGALLGLVKGCIILFVAVWALRVTGTILPEETVKQSYLLPLFLSFNPVALLTGI